MGVSERKEQRTPEDAELNLGRMQLPGFLGIISKKRRLGGTLPEIGRLGMCLSHGWLDV